MKERCKLFACPHSCQALLVRNFNKNKMLPNTTPTPNIIFNGEMKKMSDTEFRIVMIVVRATLGWELDKKTGMRKVEDWISHSQLIEKSGRGSRAISYAIDSCVKKGWIETRDEKGELLKTADERKLLGKKIFYRLGKVFLETIANNANLPSQSFPRTIALDDSKPSQKVRTTKETNTKENIQKIVGKADEEFNLLNEIKKILKDKQKHIQIIGIWLKAKDPDIENKKQLQSFIKRNLRAAKLLEGYSNRRIIEVIKWLKDNADFKITLETVGKFVDEDLQKLEPEKILTIK